MKLGEFVGASWFVLRLGEECMGGVEGWNQEH